MLIYYLVKIVLVISLLSNLGPDELRALKDLYVWDIRVIWGSVQWMITENSA